MVFAHCARPEWGRAVIVEELDDRTTYVFENAGERTLINTPFRLEVVELPLEEREALAATLLRHRNAAKSRSAAARKRPAKPADGMSFEKQEQLFRERFAEGFTDPTYVQEVRGGSEGGTELNLDGLVALAQELLSLERLDAAIARGAFSEVHADAEKVLALARRLAFAKSDKPVFDKMPATSHEPFALALRALLYGEGAYAVRFNAFVRSIGEKGVPWTVATVFAAAVHPDSHVLVKQLTSARQARSLGVPVPPSGGPNGAAYARHLAVAQALRDRLVAAGRAPRDLFDVYTYQWRTLAKTGTKTAAKTAAAATTAAANTAAATAASR